MFVLAVKHEGGRIGEITINRAEKMNAMTLQMRKDIGKALLAFEQDPEVGAIVVRGAGGKSFSAGGDVGEFLRITPSDLLDWGEDISSTERMTKPVVAQLEGYTFGAGLELALSCDIRIASPDVQMALPEAKLGMIPASGGITRAVKMLGLSRASYMLLLGKRLDSKTALEWGLVHEVVERELIQQRVRDIATELANLSPLVTKTLKSVLRKISDSPFDSGLDIERKTFGTLRYSADFREGVESFLAKRKANFVGE